MATRYNTPRSHGHRRPTHRLGAAGLVLGWMMGLSISLGADEPMRVGIIGLDTSHALAFTKIMNDPNAGEDVAGVRVVAAYPHGSRDIESSASRIPGYTRQMADQGIAITESIAELLEQVDAVLLLTNDGRLHLEQLREVIAAKKPVFIDKPLSGDLRDAVTMYREAQAAGVPIFSSSSLRFGAATQEVRAGSLGEVAGADTYSPAPTEKTHPDLYWYGIHGVESLFTVMGPGCEEVRRIHTPGTDVVIGRWADGRLGVFRGIRTGRAGYGGTAYGQRGVKPVGMYDGYRPLVVEIVKFFKTGKPPVEARETLEIYAFMSAAQESGERDGQPVNLNTVLEQAGYRDE